MADVYFLPAATSRQYATAPAPERPGSGGYPVACFAQRQCLAELPNRSRCRAIRRICPLD